MGQDINKASENRGKIKTKPKYRPGEWNCPKCKILNYSYRSDCIKCHIMKPSEEGI